MENTVVPGTCSNIYFPTIQTLALDTFTKFLYYLPPRTIIWQRVKVNKFLMAKTALTTGNGPGGKEEIKAGFLGKGVDLIIDEQVLTQGRHFFFSSQQGPSHREGEKNEIDYLGERESQGLKKKIIKPHPTPPPPPPQHPLSWKKGGMVERETPQVKDNY